jgi:exodeoxyribonuclease VII small subunit
MAKVITLKEILGDGDPKALLKELSFENGLKLLEELVTKVESGALPLDAAVVSYEKGVMMIEHLRGLLSGAEEKLKILQRPPAGKSE